MENSPIRRKAIVAGTVFGVIPCILGAGIAQYLRWRGTVWLSNGGAFWPIVCFVTSVAVLVAVLVGVLVGALVTVKVDVLVGVPVAVKVGVMVGVLLGVSVGQLLVPVTSRV